MSAVGARPAKYAPAARAETERRRPRGRDSSAPGAPTPNAVARGSCSTVRSRAIRAEALSASLLTRTCSVGAGFGMAQLLLGYRQIRLGRALTDARAATDLSSALSANIHVCAGSRAGVCAPWPRWPLQLVRRTFASVFPPCVSAGARFGDNTLTQPAGNDASAGDPLLTMEGWRGNERSVGVTNRQEIPAYRKVLREQA